MCVSCGLVSVEFISEYDLESHQVRLARREQLGIPGYGQRAFVRNSNCRGQRVPQSANRANDSGSEVLKPTADAESSSSCGDRPKRRTHPPPFSVVSVGCVAQCFPALPVRSTFASSLPMCKKNWTARKNASNLLNTRSPFRIQTKSARCPFAQRPSEESRGLHSPSVFSPVLSNPTTTGRRQRRTPFRPACCGLSRGE